MGFYLDLDFIKPGKNDLPGPPNALVYIKNSYGFERSELSYIMPLCVSLQAFERQINVLHKELDQILKRGEKRFSKNSN